MEIRDLPIRLSGFTGPSVSGVVPQALPARCPEQGGVRFCPAGMGAPIELFPDAGIWTESRPWIGDTHRGSEGPLSVSKGLVVDLFA